jgi:hypothetical protein
MSDREVRAAIERMEAWIADPAWEQDPDALAEWNAAYGRALANAERGPGWEALVARAHALGQAVTARTGALSVELEALRLELAGQARGGRALKGYGAGLR